MYELLQESLKDVERNEDGIVVLSPFGFKITEINGKKYVICRTEAEYLQDGPPSCEVNYTI